MTAVPSPDVERLAEDARNAFFTDPPGNLFSSLSEDDKEDYRRVVRAVLAAAGVGGPPHDVLTPQVIEQLFDTYVNEGVVIWLRSWLNHPENRERQVLGMTWEHE